MPKDKPGEREIVSVLWIEQPGDQLVATELAEGAGLQVVHAIRTGGRLPPKHPSDCGRANY